MFTSFKVFNFLLINMYLWSVATVKTVIEPWHKAANSEEGNPTVVQLGKQFAWEKTKCTVKILLALLSPQLASSQ